MTKEYSTFIESLEESRACAWFVAEWLLGGGFDVKILPSSTTPNEEERFSHVDHGDLEITQRIEVKHWPEVDFDSMENVPYDHVIVDEAYKLEKYRNATLYGYIILNASKTGCMLISARDRAGWFKKEVYDRKEKANRTFMFCPKNLIRYHDIGGKND